MARPWPVAANCTRVHPRIGAPGVHRQAVAVGRNFGLANTQYVERFHDGAGHGQLNAPGV